MYRRILFIFLVIVFLIVALNIWIGREVAKIQPSPEEKKEIPKVMVEEVATPQELSQPVPFDSAIREEKPIVTIIQPTPKEKPPAEVVPQREHISGMASSGDSLHLGTSVLSEKRAKTSADVSGSGVTEVSTKRPSDVEKKEMNQKGIVMW